MLNPEDRRDVSRMIDQGVRNSYRTKIGDTPTDAYQLTPLKYVNMYGSVAGRPIGSVANIGQFYFNTTTGAPMWFNTNRQWVDGTGSVVASN